MNDGLLKSILIILGAIVLIVFVIKIIGTIVGALLPVAIVIVAVYIVYRFLTRKKL